MADRYPPKFEKFWTAYPRKVAKQSAAKAWQSEGMEGDMYLAQAAIDDVEKRTRLKWWPKDQSKIPHPATWIRAQRWYDEGWENEIDKAERKPDTGPAKYEPIQPTRVVPWQESMMGRLMLIFALKAGGLVKSDKALDVRDKIMAEAVPAFEEDIAAGKIEPNEAAEQLAALFLAHMDEAYGMAHSESVLAIARRKAA